MGSQEYVYPVGRLDYDTRGAAAAHQRRRPRGEADASAPSASIAPTRLGLQACLTTRRSIGFASGIPLDGRRTLPAEVLLVNKGRRDQNGVLRITIREGRNRQVRRMLEAVGHPVQSLRRTRFGPLRTAGCNRERGENSRRRNREVEAPGKMNEELAKHRAHFRDFHVHRLPPAAASLRQASAR